MRAAVGVDAFRLSALNPHLHLVQDKIQPNPPANAKTRPIYLYRKRIEPNQAIGETAIDCTTAAAKGHLGRYLDSLNDGVGIARGGRCAGVLFCVVSRSRNAARIRATAVGLPGCGVSARNNGRRRFANAVERLCRGLVERHGSRLAERRARDFGCPTGPFYLGDSEQRAGSTFECPIHRIVDGAFAHTGR